MNKEEMKTKGFSTQCCHAGQQCDPLTGAHNTPIYQTTTYAFKDVDHGAKLFSDAFDPEVGLTDGYIYTRFGNPTQNALEEKVAALEKGEAALAFSSGMAAISAVFLLLVKPGDHILADNSLYGTARDFLIQIMQKFGADVSFADFSDSENVTLSIKASTKVVYFETPTNPKLKCVDIREVSRIAKEKGINVVVDNTFMTPYFQNPLLLGADVVVHSATKYMTGHGDSISGIAVSSRIFINQLRSLIHNNMGGVISPFNAWLVLRGLKTLPLRMRMHQENAMAVAKYLESHPAVSTVNYPGLPVHPQHEIIKAQASGFGGVLSFELKNGFEAGKKLMNSVKLCTLAVSLGDVDTLIEHPASTTHAVVPRAERIASGLSEGLVRLSVGIEDIEDIIADLEQGLEGTW
jgi:methionine-gamma-lyase